jgi:hypothetical protein
MTKKHKENVNSRGPTIGMFESRSLRQAFFRIAIYSFCYSKPSASHFSVSDKAGLLGTFMSRKHKRTHRSLNPIRKLKISQHLLYIAPIDYLQCAYWWVRSSTVETVHSKLNATTADTLSEANGGGEIRGSHNLSNLFPFELFEFPL